MALAGMLSRGWLTRALCWPSASSVTAECAILPYRCPAQRISTNVRHDVLHCVPMSELDPRQAVTWPDEA